MFDCPLATHTSPTRTFVTTLVVSPATVNVCGAAFGFIGLSQIFQTPFVAMVEIFWPANATVISPPSRPLPQTGTRVSHCKTALF